MRINSSKLPPLLKLRRAGKIKSALLRQGYTAQAKLGFTLLELLVVIAIIGILASLAFVSFESAEDQARNATRRSDLKQYQSLLEVAANNNKGFYPKRTGEKVPASDIAGGTWHLCNDLGLTGCHGDPRDNDVVCGGSKCRYYYQSDPGCGGGGYCSTRYTLRTRLETGSGDFFVICSNGKSGMAASSTTWLNADGLCPALY